MTEKVKINILESLIQEIERDHPEYQEENTTGWDLMENAKRFVKELKDAPKNNPSFYDSNTDSMIIPEEPGWYANWRNSSGDTCISKLPKKPNNSKHAFAMMTEKVAGWDCIESLLTYGEVK